MQTKEQAHTDGKRSFLRTSPTTTLTKQTNNTHGAATP